VKIATLIDMSDDEQDGSQYIKMQPAVSSSPLRSETSGRSKQQLSGDQEDLEREKRSQRNRGEEEHAVGSIPVEHLNVSCAFTSFMWYIKHCA